MTYKELIFLKMTTLVFDDFHGTKPTDSCVLMPELKEVHKTCKQEDFYFGNFPSSVSYFLKCNKYHRNKT